MLELMWETRAVVFSSLNDLEKIIRSAWSAASCDPVDLEQWSPENPARGQCAVTALVLQELLGGDLLLADVLNPDGTRQGVHFWNRLAGGIEVDLTREQFSASETVQASVVVQRPPDLSVGRVYRQYLALVGAVRTQLARHAATADHDQDFELRRLSPP